MRLREGSLARNVGILNLEMLCAHLDSFSLTRRGIITFERVARIGALDVCMQPLVAHFSWVDALDVCVWGWGGVVVVRW